MPHDPHAQFDATVLDLIEHSSTGAVPATPSYQDALGRLHASHQVYPDADHKNGHVTARSLARLPSFNANNLEAFAAGQIEDIALEANAAIFDRYVQSLPAALLVKAEGFRAMVAGRPSLHRAKVGGSVAHDPLHTLFLVPGTGPNPGLPGNYLHGSLFQVDASAAALPWAVHVHDSDDGDALFAASSLPVAMEKLLEVLASAPFNMNELGALGFTLN